MTDREKLGKLLVESARIYEYKSGGKWEYSLNLEEIVEHLLSHGATVRKMRKPLTVEELSEYLGEIIWKEEPFLEIIPIRAFYKGWCALEYEEFGGEEYVSRLNDYNYTWRCWAEKPTEEERKAAEWL